MFCGQPPAGYFLGVPIARLCSAFPTYGHRLPESPIGPGDYLHDAILKWLGRSPTHGCGCKNRTTQMNCWGPAGCREHLEEIVDWLCEESKKVIVRWLPHVPGSRQFIRLMVLSAIKKSEQSFPLPENNAD